MNVKNVNIIALVTLWVLVIGLITGWIANIVKLCYMTMDTISGMLIARVAGIFVAPLGSVLGYF